MRIVRTLIPTLALTLVLQGAVAVLPHDHGCETPRSGDALVAASVVDVVGECLACSVNAPVVVAAASISSLDAVDHCFIAGTARRGGAIRAVAGVFDPRGPPQVL